MLKKSETPDLTAHLLKDGQIFQTSGFSKQLYLLQGFFPSCPVSDMCPQMLLRYQMQE